MTNHSYGVQKWWRIAAAALLAFDVAISVYVAVALWRLL
jgi:hypothetical protein